MMIKGAKSLSDEEEIKHIITDWAGKLAKNPMQLQDNRTTCRQQQQAHFEKICVQSEKV